MCDEPPPRRRFQFSLLTLMIVVTVVSVILATLPLLTDRVYVLKSAETDNWNRDSSGAAIEVIYPAAKWWKLAMLGYASLIGLAVWFVRKKR